MAFFESAKYRYQCSTDRSGAVIAVDSNSKPGLETYLHGVDHAFTTCWDSDNGSKIKRSKTE